MTKEAYDVYQGEQTTLGDVAQAVKADGHEENPSLKATETREGYIEAFFSVDRHGGSPLAVGTYQDANAPALPANAIPTRAIVVGKVAKAGSGTLKVQLGGSDVATVTTAVQQTITDLDAFASASEQTIDFDVSSDTITAGAVRVRLYYLRG
jgi:hypothetical protein